MVAIRRFFLFLLTLAVLIAAAPMLIPYDQFQPKLEASLQQRMQMPVSIGGIRFAYSPTPQLVLDNVTLGKGSDGQLTSVIVPVTLRNLWNWRSELADVTIEGADLSQSFAMSLPGRLKPNPGGRDIHLASLRLKNVSVKLQKGMIGPLSGVLKLNPDGSFKDVTLTDEQERARLNIKPLDDKFSLTLEANNWELPSNADIRFSGLLLKGMADRNGVLIDQIKAQIFNSVVVGQAQLNWDAGWRLEGDVGTKSIQVEPLISAFSPITRSTGRMEANAHFLFQGEDYESLFKSRQIDMKFIVRDGQLHNLDLVAPLRSSDPSMTQRGGQTRFDTLSGLASLKDDSLQLDKLDLNSGKYSANGRLKIGTDKQLSGYFSSRLQAGAIVVNSSLAISGKLDAPEIRSAGASKPGAVPSAQI